jgi:hypothetical protein
MKLSVQFILALCALLSMPCSAAEPSVCKSLCSEDKRECRKEALQKTELDSNPMMSSVEPNRDARALAKLEGRSAAGRGREKSDFQKRKSERDGACDATYMRCARACTSAAPEAAAKR